MGIFSKIFRSKDKDISTEHTEPFTTLTFSISDEKIKKILSSPPKTGLPEIPKRDELYRVNHEGIKLDCKLLSVSTANNFCFYEAMAINKIYRTYFLIASHREILYFSSPQKELLAASISNNGSFCFCNSNFDDKKGCLIDCFYVYNSSFKCCASYCFDYVPESIKISDNGSFAVLCALREILIYEVKTGKLIKQFKIVGNSRITDIQIDENKKMVSLQHYDVKNQPYYRYSFDGELLDEMSYEARGITGFDLFQQILNQIPENISSLSAEEALKNACAISECFKLKFYGFQAAQAYRLQGELFLQGNDKASALDSFTNALRENPKIGVKRQAAKLQQELSTQI